VYAYPGLKVAKDGVARRLFKTPEEARSATEQGIAALLERQLGTDLGWLERDLRALREVGALAATLAPVEKLREDACEAIRRWVTDCRRVGQQSASGFEAAVEKAKGDLRGLVPRFVDMMREILGARQELLMLPQPYAGMAQELAALLPPDFLRRTPYAQLAHFPRYLKAMKLRAERARQNPTKDAERAAQLAPYVAAAAQLRGREGGEALRWLVEELRVSLFAQELGTAEPVSAVKLDRALTAVRTGGPVREEAADKPGPTAKPIVSVPIAEKKAAPIKNLGALDKLFKR
jgi:ATP-dependent helicase HrpA